MRSEATTPDGYIAGLDGERRELVATLRDTINSHLPEGYVEEMAWGMLTWSVPLAESGPTYNGKPLAYAALASQKNYVSVYLMGLYSDGTDLGWFKEQYAERGLKLDMGKSCVRIKHLDEVPLEVLGEAIGRIPVGEFLARHERDKA